MKKIKIKRWVVPAILVLLAGVIYAYIEAGPDGTETSSRNTDSIRELRRQDIKAGYYTLAAFVINQDRCVCPAGALCEPCFSSIIISDTGVLSENKTGLADDQLKIFIDSDDVFTTGKAYNFKIYISDPAKRSSADYPNGIELAD